MSRHKTQYKTEQYKIIVNPREPSLNQVNFGKYGKIG